MSLNDVVSLNVRVQGVFDDLVSSLDGLNVISVRVPRKWKGESFPAKQIPIAVVKADCYNRDKVFRTVGEVASRNHVATMSNNAYRNAASEILIYIQLKKDESK